jgi:gamma-F420-2:alpha-L-glutamate ligase
MTEIVVPHLTRNGTESGSVQLPTGYEHLKLDRVNLIGENKIVYYNSRDPVFYQKQIINPRCTVWIIRRNILLNYCTKRMIETGWEMNIQVEERNIPNFEVLLDHVDGPYLVYNGEKITKKELPDFILPRMGATIDYGGLSVIKQLEAMGATIINGYTGLLNTKDKLTCYQTLSASKLPFPKTLFAKFPLNPSLITQTFSSYPVIMKIVSGSQGKGVMIVQKEEQITDISDMIDKKNPIVFQEFVKKSTGKDIRVLVVGDSVVGGMMRKASKGFKSNIHQGGTGTAVPISIELESMAVNAAKAVGLEICGIDFLIGEDNYYICEINSSPGFEGYERYVGANVAHVVLSYLSNKK